jgi:hypothetical protein
MMTVARSAKRPQTPKGLANSHPPSSDKIETPIKRTDDGFQFFLNLDHLGQLKKLALELGKICRAAVTPETARECGLTQKEGLSWVGFINEQVFILRGVEECCRI